MKVLVVGGGAREHAIAQALSESDSGVKLYAFMSAVNPGISRLAKEYGIGDICNPADVMLYSKKTNVAMAVVGPEAPLAAGVVDRLEDAGIMCVGPAKAPAQLETDKSFARSLMRKHRIEGTPAFGIFDNVKDAYAFIDDFGGDLAVKPAGLTGGKGVKIMGEHFDAAGAKEYVKEIFDTRMGSITKVVLEERLIGEEFTLQAFVDGSRVVGTPTVQDHKRAFEGDMGPNTGGMGSYCDKGYLLPFLTQKDYDDGIGIMESTVKAVKAETGKPYKGFLYGQFMACADGVKTIEYNARLGDPEAMNMLSVLDSDLRTICEQVASGRLDGKIRFKPKATVCKYTVPAGYPTNPKNRVEVSVDEKKITELGCRVYYASVSLEGGKIYTSKSRAVAVVGIDDTIYSAQEAVEKCMPYVKGDLIYRKDIGTRNLVEKRISHMRQLRG